MCSLGLFIFNKQDVSKHLDTEGIWEKKNFFHNIIEVIRQVTTNPNYNTKSLVKNWNYLHFTQPPKLKKFFVQDFDQIKSIVELNIAIITNIHWQPIQDWPHCCQWMTSSTCFLIRLNALLSKFSPIHHLPWKLSSLAIQWFSQWDSFSTNTSIVASF